MKTYTKPLLWLISILMLVSCQQGAIATESTEGSVSDIQITIQPSSLNTLEPYIFKTSMSGTVTLHGILVVTNPAVIAPDSHDAIFLAPLAGSEGGISTIPSFNVGDVPQAEVDEGTGEFVFADVQPGHYAIVVLTTGGAQVPARFHENGSLTIVRVNDSDRDQTIELGYLDFP